MKNSDFKLTVTLLPLISTTGHFNFKTKDTDISGWCYNIAGVKEQPAWILSARGKFQVRKGESGYNSSRMGLCLSFVSDLVGSSQPVFS
jgi:hypothetical protein